MELNQEAIDLVKKWEGLRLDAYRDPVNVVTIGYGYTNGAGFGPGVKMGDRWTQEQAEAMLRQGLKLFADKIRPHFTREPNPNQFGAFVSLAYNIGWQSFIKSTALKRFNAGDVKGAAEALMWWNKAGGQVLAGLKNRREDEVRLFLTGLGELVQGQVVMVSDQEPPAEARVTPDPERTSPAQSTTLQAASGAVAGAATVAGTAVSQLDGTAQIVVIAAAAVIGLCLLWIMRERLRKWAQGVR